MALPPPDKRYHLKTAELQTRPRGVTDCEETGTAVGHISWAAADTSWRRALFTGGSAAAIALT